MSEISLSFGIPKSGQRSRKQRITFGGETATIVATGKVGKSSQVLYLNSAALEMLGISPEGANKSQIGVDVRHMTISNLEALPSDSFGVLPVGQNNKFDSKSGQARDGKIVNYLRKVAGAVSDTNHVVFSVEVVEANLNGAPVPTIKLTYSGTLEADETFIAYFTRKEGEEVVAESSPTVAPVETEEVNTSEGEVTSEPSENEDWDN